MFKEIKDGIESIRKQWDYQNWPGRFEQWLGTSRIIHTHTYTHIFVYVYVHVCICMCLYLYICRYMHSYLCICGHTCMCIHVCTKCICIHVCLCVCIYKYMYVHRFEIRNSTERSSSKFDIAEERIRSWKTKLKKLLRLQYWEKKEKNMSEILRGIKDSEKDQYISDQNCRTDIEISGDRLRIFQNWQNTANHNSRKPSKSQPGINKKKLISL